MRKEWIYRCAKLFALPSHHVDGIVQEGIANFRSGIRHKNASPGLLPHQNRQCPNVILVGMRHDDCVELPILQRFQIGQRLITFEFRMHSAIEHEPAVTCLDVIGVCSNFDAPGEIKEFQAL